MEEQPSEKILRLAQGRWDAIFKRLAPELNDAISRAPQGRNPRHVRCPVHGSSGNNDGFRFFREWRDKGNGICNTCGALPNGIAMLAWVKGLSFTDALKLLFDELDGPGASIPPPRRKTRQEIEREKARQLAEDRKRVANIRRVWSETLCLRDRRAEPARLYFARRGLKVYHQPKLLRFHPRLYYRLDDEVVNYFPALVFRVVDSRGWSTTLHRIYLTEDGEKAPVPAVKKLMSYPEGLRKLAGGAIRLVPASTTLGVAEGPETALAIIQNTGMPVWSAINATLMEQIVIPREVKQVVAWLDKDVSGRGKRAGSALCQRLWAEGTQAGAVEPALAIEKGATSIDWLDVANRMGPSGFPAWTLNWDDEKRRVAS